MTETARIITTGRLTLKQEKFCHEYLKTGNASEAYRRAYDVGRTTRDDTIRGMAHTERRKPHISARIAELAEKYIKPISVTPEWIEERLTIEALNAQTDGARASNLKTLAQVHAMLTMKHEDEAAGMSDAQLALAIAGADYSKAPASPDELSEKDRGLHDAILRKLGG